ncbi:Alpha/Beta hydrolase protein [Flammula alnicola]|nr:Alpha/Beta hydrolase protein [Flammula alnicola]
MSQTQRGLCLSRYSFHRTDLPCIDDAASRYRRYRTSSVSFWNKRAVLRNIKLAGMTSTRLVEIWNKGVLQTALDVTDYHGDFMQMNSLHRFPLRRPKWHSCTLRKAMHLRARILPKISIQPRLWRRSCRKEKTNHIHTALGRFSGNDSQNNIHLVQLKTLEDVRFGQAVFSPNSDQVIYATGYEFTADGRILGIKGCFNRPSGIWKLRISTPIAASGKIAKPPAGIDVEFQKLTPPHLSCRSPRPLVDQGRSILVWLSCRTGGAHLASSTLHMLDISSDPSSARLDISSASVPAVSYVETPSNPNEFPGLYPAYNLPSLPSATAPSVISSALGVLLHSQWGSRTTVLQICIDNGSWDVNHLTPIVDDHGNLYSWSVLATDGHARVICSRSSPSVPYEIMLGEFSATGSFSWRSLDNPALSESVAAALSSIKTSIVPIPGRPLVETILIQGPNKESEGAKAPCITSPHGGPHGATSTAFSATTTALVLEGYTLSLPNYTGSPGYGEKFLQDLIGRCGELDVEDCIASARRLIELGISEEGPGKQFITGGSHGGFLTAHLIGQYPDFFSAAILRNPVISVGEISLTDIPDWYFSEFGLPYPLSSSSPSGSSSDGANEALPPFVTVDTFAKLQAASPVAYIDSIKVPVLLLVGAADRRVAPSHGIEFYHALKARYSKPQKKEKGCKVDMLVFEGESHPLDGVEACRASFEATRDWFAEARGILASHA